ncbi:unnamed protein product, partial [Mesorhabditis belari]|uniref:TOG domain-containing protein n=1 Tax=Mesorhabditis belari TaxID=2138241 RepID=A0AAF3F605_9BILA
MSWLADLLVKNSSDPRERLELGQALVSSLQIQPLPTDSTQLNDFCDIAFQWLAGSNFKVALLALEALDVAVNVNGPVLMPYLIDRITQMIDRLGDSKTAVRMSTSDLLFTMATNGPQIILEKVMPALGHRVWMVRCGGMDVITRIVINNKALTPQIARFLPTFCALMADPNPEVRESANEALAQLMAAFGPEIVQSIQQQKLLPDKKLEQLAARCEEALRNSPVRSSRPTTRIAQVRRFPPPTQPQPQQSFLPQRMSSHDPSRIDNEMRSAKLEAGVITEENIRDAFPQAPPQLTRPFAEELEAVKAIILDINLDWAKRQAALKRIREVAMLDEANGEVFAASIKAMTSGLTANLKDLRSQIMKETCITLCFLCERFGLRMMRLGEAVMPALLNHLKNSQNVFWSCAQVTAMVIMQCIQSPAIIQPILREFDSKAKKVREAVLILAEKALSWPPQFLQDSMKSIEKAIKNGICDADAATRAAAKVTYGTFEACCPERAQMLYLSLGPDGQKRLNAPGSKPQSRSTSQQSLVGNDAGTMRKPFMPRYPSNDRRGIADMNSSFGRSASAIDASAVAMLQSGLRRPKNPYLMGRTPVRNPIVTSQPPSRSGSPTRMGNGRGAPTRQVQPTARINTGLVRPQNHIAAYGRQKTQEDIQKALRQVQANFGFDENGFGEFARPKVPPARFQKSQEINLANVIQLIESNEDIEKRRGLETLNKMISQKAPLSSDDIKLLSDALGRIVAGARHGVMASFSDMMTSFIVTYAKSFDLNSLDFLLRQLILKAAMEVLPANAERYTKVIGSIHAHVDAQTQLVLISKKIQEPHTGYSPKVRLRMLQFLADVLKTPDACLSLNSPEVKAAVQQILTQIQDQKFAMLKPISEQVIQNLFAISVSEFSAILSQMPNQYKQLAHALLKKDPPANGSPSHTSSSIREITQKMQACQMTPTPETSTSTPASLRTTYASPTTTATTDEDGTSDSTDFEILETTQHLTHDIPRQSDRIKDILQSLKSYTKNAPYDSRNGLSWLNQMLKDKSFTVWDEYFAPCLLAIFDLLKVEDDVVVKMSLRLLEKFCFAQPQRFGPFAVTTILKVLDVCRNTNPTVVQIAEKCASSMAKLLPRADVLKATVTIIQEEKDPRVPAALKMLATLANNIDVSEVGGLVDQVASYVITAFQNDEVTAVRKAAVTVMVAFHKKVPAIMTKYLDSLPAKKRKLLDVYIQRDQSASTHF